MRACSDGSHRSATDRADPISASSDSNASRRNFLKSLGVLGAGAILPGSAAIMAQTASRVSNGKPNRIDVHQHLFSPTYVSRTRPATANPRSDPALTSWSPARAVEDMDANGIATSMMSIATGGTPSNLAGEDARTLMRGSNEYGAQMVRDFPGRFGLFASLPMLDPDAGLREIEYAFDTLKTDGIAMMTDYGDKWPGDPTFAPVFEELDRRKAVVFIHPTTPTCCGKLMPNVPAGWIEFDFDTTRAFSSLLVNGAFTRYPNVRFIFTHSGGTIPVLARRIHDEFPKELAAGAPNGVESEVKKLYFDIANGANPSSLAALTKLVPISQIFFGTDYPFVRIRTTVDGFADFGFSARDVQAINRGNAVRLFPRLKGKGE